MLFLYFNFNCIHLLPITEWIPSFKDHPGLPREGTSGDPPDEFKELVKDYDLVEIRENEDIFKHKPYDNEIYEVLKKHYEKKKNYTQINELEKIAKNKKTQSHVSSSKPHHTLYIKLDNQKVYPNVFISNFGNTNYTEGFGCLTISEYYMLTYIRELNIVQTQINVEFNNTINLLNSNTTEKLNTRFSKQIEYSFNIYRKYSDINKDEMQYLQLLTHIYKNGSRRSAHATFVKRKTTTNYNC